MAKPFTPDSSRKIKGIKYVDSTISGFSRLKKGKGFSYIDQHNKKISDPKIIERIKSLVIPPNWKNVWICPYPSGHIQVTGVDIKGRKQYIYHENWTNVRNVDKFSTLLPFGRNLPKLRNKIKREIKRDKFDLQKVCALALKIIDLTSMRPGNSFYQKQNGSYGLTTLEKKHLILDQSSISFRYKGKKGVEQLKELKKKNLSKYLEQLKSIPGKRLFKYYDAENKIHKLDASQLNSFLQKYFKNDITCKTFRTWNACYLSLEFLIKQGAVESEKEREKISKKLVEKVAHDLGNTVAVARKNYILPKIISEYINGNLNAWIHKTAKNPVSKNRIHKKLLKIITEG
jgi:DNA topoisomerase-1